jgi:hypothetical protein
MAKVFNVDQLRIGGHLLTGSPEGLFYDSDNDGYGEQLAQGTSAVPATRTLTAGAGLKIYDDNSQAADAANLTQNREIFANVDGVTLGVNGSDQLYVQAASTNAGIDHTHIKDDTFGAGLAGGDGNVVNVGGGSGIHVEGNFVNIDAGGTIASPKGVITSMLNEDAVTNEKLAVITEGNKIQGQSVFTDSAFFQTDNNTKELQLANDSVTKRQLATNVAGAGIAGGANNPLDVGGGSGLHVEGDFVNIDAAGVIASMVSDYTSSDLTKGITNGKLHPLTTTNLVEGSSVELSDAGGIGDNTATAGTAAAGLYIKTNAIGRDELDSDAVAGDGLSADSNDYINVGGGSGIHVQGDFVNINNHASDDAKRVIAGGATNHDDYIKDGSIKYTKLEGSIPVAKTNLTAGAGLSLTTDTLDVGQAATDPGITVAANTIDVNNTVVRTNATIGGNANNQTLDGNYTFSEIVVFDSGIRIAGDLEVRGSTMVTEVNEVNIGDNVIVLNADYEGAAPQDGGIELERGDKDNVMLIFDDDSGDDVWKLGKKGYEGEVLTSPRVAPDTTTNATNVYNGSFSMSKQIPSGMVRESVLFSDHLNIPAGSGLVNIPDVIVSIQNTGQAVIDPDNSTVDADTSTAGIQSFNALTMSYSDLISCMVVSVNKTGFMVDFSAAIPATGALSDYYVKAWVSAPALM